MPCHANRYVCESRMALLFLKGRQKLDLPFWHHITSPKVGWQLSETAGAMFVAERNERTQSTRLQLSCTVCTVHTEPWTL